MGTINLTHMAFYQSLLVAALIAASSAGPNGMNDEIVPEDNQPISIEKSARIALYCEGCIGQSLIAADKIFSHCADGTGSVRCLIMQNGKSCNAMSWLKWRHK